MKEPKIRFKGFRGEWEEKALGCCVAFWDSMRQPIEEVKRIKGIYPYYGASGVVDYINDYIFDEELILLSEDGANITDRNYPVCFIARGKYWVNNHAHVLKANKGFDNVFLCNNLERKDYTQYNTGMAMPKLNKEVCIRIPVLYPTLPEQQSIASYFQHLDSLIQSTTKKIESLKQVKAASLQSMFPQEGETTPRVRFKGFEGEWEETTIGKVTSVKRGVRVTRKNLRDHGLYPVYQNTDYPMGYYNRYNVESNNPFVIIGGSAGLIGFCEKDFWAADDCAYFCDSVKLDKSYLYCMLVNKNSEIKKNVRGSSVPRLDRQVINDLNIVLPSIAEQRAIASYFTTLDRQITLQSQRLEKLKQIKAACLDNMFV